MATYEITSDSIGPGVRVALTSGQSAKIHAGVTVQSMDETNTITGAQSNTSIEILGTVTGLLDDGFPCIALGFSGTTSNNHVVVQTGGAVEDGIAFWSTSSSITNAGSINSIYVGAKATGAATSSTITNSGTLDAENAIRRADTSDETLNVVNSGTITGSEYAFYSSAATAVDVITNTGMMAGSVKLGGGDDTYDGRGGRTNQSLISGDDGNDTMFGGDETESFSGGAGNDNLDGGGGYDRLHGGAGADTLTGGADNDTFSFYTVKDSSKKPGSYDLITDFSRKENDMIDLVFIDANGKEKKNGKFDFIGDDKFSRDNGELRYEIKGDHTVLYGDTNGDGKADLVIEFDGAIKFKASDFEL